jgi:thiopurine S-methyltransferase
MNADFWLARWRDGQIGFHEGAPNAHLCTALEAAAPPAGGRALVPLCGKAVDLTLLAERGMEVVGVDLSPEASAQYFAERGVEPEACELGGLPARRAGGVTLITGDVFAIPAGTLGPFDLIFDRAALVALPPERRGPYAAWLLAQLAPAGRLVVVSFWYDESVMSGPPFSVPPEELDRHFGDGLELERFAELDVVDERPRWRELGHRYLMEGAWSGRRRPDRTSGG